jgi:hypothetical protein
MDLTLSPATVIGLANGRRCQRHNYIDIVSKPVLESASHALLSRLARRS